MFKLYVSDKGLKERIMWRADMSEETMAAILNITVEALNSPTSLTVKRLELLDKTVDMALSKGVERRSLMNFLNETVDAEGNNLLHYVVNKRDEVLLGYRIKIALKRWKKP